jgi:uncharacterized membrane protein
MIQTKALAKRKIGEREGFRWRAGEITRIESLSDGVFALCVTLLIVSLEVPKTFDDLLMSLRGFIAFAACFALLMLVWYEHYRFYRRYNLTDVTSTVLTMTLLFLVLFYTYPLKFLFSAWLNPIAGIVVFKSESQVEQLFTIYGVGYIAVFLVFLSLYIHAYRHRVELELTELECWDTKNSMREMCINLSIGVLSILSVNLFDGAFSVWAGPMYALNGPAYFLHGTWGRKRRKKIFDRLYPNGTVEPKKL